MFPRLGRRVFAGGAKSKARQLALAAGKTEAEFDAAIEAASDAGAMSDEVIVAYASTPEVGAFGDGAILGFFQRIIDWLTDPTNQEKLIKVAKFILSILAMFGLVI